MRCFAVILSDVPHAARPRRSVLLPALALLASPLAACRDHGAPATPPPAVAPAASPATSPDATAPSTPHAPSRSPLLRALERYRKPAELIAALGIRPGQRVAEVGAGGGFLTLRLAQATGAKGHVIATDIDERSLAALRARAHAEGLDWIETRRVRSDETGLGPACCDLVLLAEVDQYLPDRAAYLRALVPSLRPGGRIAVSNRLQYQAELRAAAEAASLSIEPAVVDLPGQFLLLLRPRPAGASSEAAK